MIEQLRKILCKMILNRMHRHSIRRKKTIFIIFEDFILHTYLCICTFLYKILYIKCYLNITISFMQMHATFVKDLGEKSF